MALSSGESDSVEMPDDSPVSNIEVKASGSIVDPSFSAGTYEGKPDSVDTPSDGEVYNYLGVTTSANDDSIDTAKFRTTVEKSWVEDRGVSSGNLVVSRWQDGEWQTLETTVKEETGGEIVLEAKTPGFSVFAVTASETKETTATATETETATPEPTQESTPAATETSEPTDIPTDSPSESGGKSRGVPGFGILTLLAGFVAASRLRN